MSDQQLPPPPSVAVSKREIAGRYQLMELLGEGGMGSVYRAYDMLLEEPVALKLLRSDITSEATMMERFRREVKLARKVTHPNVARVYDLGADAGEHFITMELVEGVPLSKLVENAPLPVEQAVSIARKICAGLGAAHSAGVVHRDLKPENIMITASGAVSLTDFGVARALDKKAFPSMTMGTLGTPHYMSPEQVAQKDADARADIYALGVMLYEMVTGALPFDDGSIFVVAVARLRQEPPDPRQRASVDDTLAEIILRCMARDREQRYAAAAEVDDALAAIELSVASDHKRQRPAIFRTTSSASVAIFASANDSLGVGFCSLLTNALYGTPRLLVRPAFRLAASYEAREAARTLQTDAVADISVRDTGERLLLIMRLIDTRQGVARVADRVELSITELVAAADKAASAIATGMGCGAPPLLPPALAEARAARCYLQARHAQLRQTSEANDRAIALLEQALRQLPSDPFIHGAYAEALVRRLEDEYAFLEDVQEAREMAMRALAQAPQLASARVALAGALFELGEVQRAARELARAEQLRPSFPEMHSLLGRLLALSDKLEAADLELSHALQTGAASAALFDRVMVLCLASRSEEAEVLLAEFSGPQRHAARYWITRGRLLLYRGDKARLRQLLREASDSVARARGEVLNYLGPLAGAGSIERASQTFYAAAQDVACSPRRKVFFMQLTAELQLSGDRQKEALDAIEQGVDAGMCDLAWMDHCPLLDDVKHSVRFRALRRRVAERAERIASIIAM